MKTLYYTLTLAACAAALSACSGDDAQKVPATPEAGNVRFALQTPAAGSFRGPVRSNDDFRILAFKQNGADYLYYQDIPVGGMGFDGTKLSGTVQLPAGDYKFVPTFGLTAAGNYTWPELAGKPLADELHIEHTASTFPEAFMLNVPIDKVPAYKLSLDGPALNVEATLRRAVSRVDVLFLRADKNAAGDYVEKSGDDVFGPEKLAQVEMEYTGANSQLGISGEKGAATFDVTHVIDPAGVLTMGTGASTLVGTKDYDFDAVASGDIVTGSAHLQGTFLIPNTVSTASTGLTMRLTSGEGNVRTITLPDGIPVERNKVTLIRIYVLGTNVFTTGVDFAVTVDTVWDGTNNVDGAID